MPLAATTAAILSKSTGNAQSNINNLRTLRDRSSSEAASMGDSLQSQINSVVGALMNPGAVTQIQVVDQTGALIGWIGSQIIGGVSYEGGWFLDLYIGGTGPANAVITANGGGVTITNAPIKLTSNGVETDINNETLPAWGAGVSLVSIDTSVTHGDQSFIAPQAMGVFSWNGTALTSVAVFGDGGSGQGFLELNGVGNSDQIAMNIDPAAITLTDGTHTCSIGPTTINVATIDATTLVNSPAYQASGTPGIGLSTSVITALSSVSGGINYGSSLTVNTSTTGVFGTPGAGQTNGTVVTGVTLNTTHTAVVTGGTSVNHTWTEGLLTA